MHATPKCAGCKKRILESEPDYTLRHLEGGQGARRHRRAGSRLGEVMPAPEAARAQHVRADRSSSR